MANRMKKNTCGVVVNRDANTMELDIEMLLESIGRYSLLVIDGFIVAGAVFIP